MRHLLFKMNQHSYFNLKSKTIKNRRMNCNFKIALLLILSSCNFTFCIDLNYFNFNADSTGSELSDLLTFVHDLPDTKYNNLAFLFESFAEDSDLHWSKMASSFLMLSKQIFIGVKYIFVG